MAEIEPSVQMARPPGRKPRRKKIVRPDLRHWPKEWEFTIRAARPDEGEAIHALVDEATGPYGWTLPTCTWTKVAPFWYVAEVQGVLLGAVQVCIGWPISQMTLLAIRPKLSQTKKAKIVKSLCYHVLQAMMLDGAELACALIPDNDRDFPRILERAGLTPSGKGRMYFYRVKELGYGI